MPEQPAPDFSKPGDDGALPDGFIPWRWAVTYTVHPELLSLLQCGEEYRVTVSVLRKATEEPAYAALYKRAIGIANGRATRLRRSDENALLHTRVVTHGWFTHRNTSLARAFVALGVVFLKKGESGPEGQPLPTRKDFEAPGGMTPENYTLPPAKGDKRVQEIYSEGDVRDPAAQHSNIFTLSYGEYVPFCGSVEYAVLVARAQDLARFHFSVDNPANDHALRIVRREWFCATNPDIAVVHLYVHTSTTDELI